MAVVVVVVVVVVVAVVVLVVVAAAVVAVVVVVAAAVVVVELVVVVVVVAAVAIAVAVAAVVVVVVVAAAAAVVVVVVVGVVTHVLSFRLFFQRRGEVCTAQNSSPIAGKAKLVANCKLLFNHQHGNTKKKKQISERGSKKECQNIECKHVCLWYEFCLVLFLRWKPGKSGMCCSERFRILHEG